MYFLNLLKFALYSPSFSVSIALSIKCCNTLSNIVIKSAIKKESFDHSSKCSKLTEDKQQTAVLSSSVGKVISEHRLLCLISKPKSFCFCGKASLHLSILTM